MSRAAREVQEPALDDVELRSEPEDTRAPRKFCDGGGVYVNVFWCFILNIYKDLVHVTQVLFDIPSHSR